MTPPLPIPENGAISFSQKSGVLNIEYRLIDGHAVFELDYRFLALYCAQLLPNLA
jgi:hypothetical protein